MPYGYKSIKCKCQPCNTYLKSFNQNIVYIGYCVLIGHFFSIGFISVWSNKVKLAILLNTNLTVFK